MILNHRILAEYQWASVNFGDATQVETAFKGILRTYFNFQPGSANHTRMNARIKELLEEYKPKSGFFEESEPRKLKSSGFNKILNSLLQEVWVQNGLEGDPREIKRGGSFFDLEKADFRLAKVELKNAWNYISSHKNFAFPGIGFEQFFNISVTERTRLCLQMAEAQGAARFLDNLKFTGCYFQVIYYGGLNLLQEAEDYYRSQIVTTQSGDIGSDNRFQFTPDQRLAGIIWKKEPVKEGAVTVPSRKVLEAQLRHSHTDLLDKDDGDYLRFEMFFEGLHRVGSFSKQKIRELAWDVCEEFRREMKYPELEKPQQRFEWDLVIDMLMFEIRKFSNTPISDQKELVKYLSVVLQKVREYVSHAELKHVYLVYALLSEIKKHQSTMLEKHPEIFKAYAAKLGMEPAEVQLVYHLIQSDHEDMLENFPLVQFVNHCVKQENENNLNPRQKEILKKLFSVVPDEIKMNQFYAEKEKIKELFKDPDKQKAVDGLMALIGARIRERRLDYAKARPILVQSHQERQKNQ